MTAWQCYPVIDGVNCQPAVQVNVVAGMFETLAEGRKLLIAAVEIAFGLLLLDLGYEALTSPATSNPGMWTLIGVGLLLGGGVVVFYSVREFRALLEVYTGKTLTLPRLKLPRLTFRRKLLEPYGQK